MIASSNGRHAEGEYNLDKSGKAKITFKFKLGEKEYDALYEGDVINYLTPHGKGTLEVGDFGMTYIGEMKHDQINGLGKMTFTNGTTLEGRF